MGKYNKESTPVQIKRELKGLCYECDERVHFPGERLCPTHGGRRMDPDKERIVDDFIRNYRFAKGDKMAQLEAYKKAKLAIYELEKGSV